MKAAVYDRYGAPDVVRLADVPKPVPKRNEVLIRIRATTVTTADWRGRSLCMPPGFGLMGRLFFGITRPRQPILGTELAGDVEAVGADVTAFKPGDAVFAFPGARMGGHAEYICIPADGMVAHKPANLSYEEAAALSFGGTTALHFLQKGNVRPGERVLVNGASGGVGTAVVQLAVHIGAQVTAVCSGANAELVRSLGAVRAIDYTREDFATMGERYDAIVDTVGTAGYARSRTALAPNGRLLLVLGGLGDMLRAPWVAATGGGRRIIAGTAAERPEDLRRLAELAEAGVFRPVIDCVYPLERIVDAHRRVDTGHKRGNVVVTVTAG